MKKLACSLLAGANAALEIDGKDPLVLSRADAYGGVMVDDLVAGGLDEPYRLFTSRAEHRLSLRADNADRRLVPLAARCGLVDEKRAQQVVDKTDAINAHVAKVPEQIQRRIAGEGLSFADTVALCPDLGKAPTVIGEGAWIEIRYAAYLEREQHRINRLKSMRDVPLPSQMDWTKVPGLSNEGRSRMAKGDPRSLGEAEALPGVTPGDVETLWAWIESKRKQE